MKHVKCVSEGEYLTIGKIYKVERVIKSLDQTFIAVVNDKGMELYFNTSPVTGLRKLHQPNFIDIEEDRNNKLNQLGI
jgi:hypothetical protein